MALLFSQMCSMEFDRSSLTKRRIVELVCLGMVFRKVQTLRSEPMDIDDDGVISPGMDINQEEEFWAEYGKPALSKLGREILWRGIELAYDILKYPAATSVDRTYMDELLRSSPHAWCQIYSERPTSRFFTTLIDYIIYQIAY